MANGWHDGSKAVCIDYLDMALMPDKRPELLSRVTRHLAKIVDTFDAIAVSGVSGMLVGVPVADRLGKEIIVVRKPNDIGHAAEGASHSHLSVEGSIQGRYIIVDDLVCTHSTLRRIVQTIEDKHNKYAKCIGIYLWYTKIVAENANSYLGIDRVEGPLAQIPLIVNAQLRTSMREGTHYEWM